MVLAGIISVVCMGCSKESDEPVMAPSAWQSSEEGTSSMVEGSVTSVAGKKIILKVGDNTLSMTLVDNAATRRLWKLCQSGDVTLRMHEYGGFEMVGTLPESLPTSNVRLSTTVGDVVLYNGNRLVVFFGSNTWSYTRIGRIENATPEGVRSFFGGDNVGVKLNVGAN